MDVKDVKELPITKSISVLKICFHGTLQDIFCFCLSLRESGPVVVVLKVKNNG